MPAQIAAQTPQAEIKKTESFLEDNFLTTQLKEIIYAQPYKKTCSQIITKLELIDNDQVLYVAKVLEQCQYFANQKIKECEIDIKFVECSITDKVLEFFLLQLNQIKYKQQTDIVVEINNCPNLQFESLKLDFLLLFHSLIFQFDRNFELFCDRNSIKAKFVQNYSSLNNPIKRQYYDRNGTGKYNFNGIFSDQFISFVNLLGQQQGEDNNNSFNIDLPKKVQPPKDKLTVCVQYCTRLEKLKSIRIQTDELSELNTYFEQVLIPRKQKGLKTQIMANIKLSMIKFNHYINSQQELELKLTSDWQISQNDQYELNNSCNMIFQNLANLGAIKQFQLIIDKGINECFEKKNYKAIIEAIKKMTQIQEFSLNFKISMTLQDDFIQELASVLLNVKDRIKSFKLALNYADKLTPNCTQRFRDLFAGYQLSTLTLELINVDSEFAFSFSEAAKCAKNIIKFNFCYKQINYQQREELQLNDADDLGILSESEQYFDQEKIESYLYDYEYIDEYQYIYYNHFSGESYPYRNQDINSRVRYDHLQKSRRSARFKHYLSEFDISNSFLGQITLRTGDEQDFFRHHNIFSTVEELKIDVRNVEMSLQSLKNINQQLAKNHSLKKMTLCMKQTYLSFSEEDFEIFACFDYSQENIFRLEQVVAIMLDLSHRNSDLKSVKLCLKIIKNEQANTNNNNQKAQQINWSENFLEKICKFLEKQNQLQQISLLIPELLATEKYQKRMIQTLKILHQNLIFLKFPFLKLDQSIIQVNAQSDIESLAVFISELCGIFAQNRQHFRFYCKNASQILICLQQIFNNNEFNQIDVLLKHIDQEIVIALLDTIKNNISQIKELTIGFNGNYLNQKNEINLEEMLSDLYTRTMFLYELNDVRQRHILQIAATKKNIQQYVKRPEILAEMVELCLDIDDIDQEDWSSYYDELHEKYFS